MSGPEIVQHRSALISLSILTLGFGVIVGVQSSSLDFPIADGAFYFEQAQMWAQPGTLLQREWSPLFVAAYGVLHKVFPSHQPLLLYLFHRGLVLYLTMVVFWAVSRRLFPARVAVILSLGLLGLDGMLNDFAVVHVAGLLVSLVLLVVALQGSRGTVWSLVGLAALGIWIRTEILVILVALIGVFIAKLLKGTLRLPPVAGLTVFLIGVTGSVILYAFSFAPPGANREFGAFSQRFVWAEMRASDESMRGGHMGYAEQIRSIFGQARSIPEAFLSNPKAFLGHLKRNIARLPAECFRTFLPGGRRGPWVPMLFLVLLFMSMEGGAGLHLPALFWLVSGAAATAAFAVSLLLEPSANYLPLAAPLALFGVTNLLGRTKQAMLASKRPVWPRHRAGAPVLIVGITVLVFLLIPHREFEERQVVVLSEALMEDTHRVKIVYAFSGMSYCAYLRAHDKACRYLPTTILQESELLAFLEGEQLNTIIVDDFVRRFFHDSGSRLIEGFEAAPQDWDFRQVRTANGMLGDARLYIHSAAPGAS